MYRTLSLIFEFLLKVAECIAEPTVDGPIINILALENVQWVEDTTASDQSIVLLEQSSDKSSYSLEQMFDKSSDSDSRNTLNVTGTEENKGDDEELALQSQLQQESSQLPNRKPKVRRGSYLVFRDPNDESLVDSSNFRKNSNVNDYPNNSETREESVNTISTNNFTIYELVYHHWED